jgi:hypothetical protein
VKNERVKGTDKRISRRAKDKGKSKSIKWLRRRPKKSPSQLKK